MPISPYCCFYFDSPYGAHSCVRAHCAEAESSSNIAFIRVSNNDNESGNEEKAVRQYISHLMNDIVYLSSVPLYMHI